MFAQQRLVLKGRRWQICLPWEYNAKTDIPSGDDMKRTNRRFRNTPKSNSSKKNLTLGIISHWWKMCSPMTLPGTNVGLRGESEKRCCQPPGPKCGRCKPGGGKWKTMLGEMPTMEIKAVLFWYKRKDYVFFFQTLIFSAIYQFKKTHIVFTGRFS